jgi:hypothetical protein
MDFRVKYKALIMNLLTLLLLFFEPFKAESQSAIASNYPVPLYTKIPATLLDGDTVAIFNLNPVVVVSERIFPNVNDAMKYYILRRDVKVAYPYAIMAEATFKQCEETMQTMTSESEKRRYLKEMEKQMMDQYKDDLKNMTVNQGRILIKLINRETGTTSYEMVKELRGSLSAFMWQTVARVFGNNLKDIYDPETEDKEVENIIQLIEVGAI